MQKTTLRVSEHAGTVLVRGSVRTATNIHSLTIALLRDEVNVLSLMHALEQIEYRLEARL